MLYDPATASHLKPWLVRTLEPICDAEPGALADYILALLKHNVPENEMRKELEVQLDEFLEKECKPFADTLFTVLRTKSYLPYASSPPPSFNSKLLDSGIPIPLDAFTQSGSERNLKRSHDTDDQDDRPSKGPRLGSDGRYGGRPDGRMWNRHSGADNGYGAGPSSEGRRQHGYHPPEKRGICRDYHNSGYCARGVHCKYSHGEDAVVPNPFFMGGPPVPGALPFLPMFPGLVPFAAAAAAAAYDPRESRMDMRPLSNRPHSRPAVMSRMQEDGPQITRISGELPVIQDLTPTIPQEPEGDGSNSQPPGGPEASSSSIPMQNGFNGMSYPMNGQFFQPQNLQEDTEMGNPEGVGERDSGSGFRGRRGTGRGRPFGDAQRFRPERKGDKTLVVEKIPEDKLTMGHLNEWFSKFGTVTNVAMDRSSAKALVSFSTHDEAHAAWKSEDAVFNNRFVKIFWHRPMEGHGIVGARALAASAPLVANIAAKASQPSAPVVAPPTTVTSSSAKKTTSSTASALAAKQQLLEQQIAEQKQLMASLESASSPEEKKEIMARLRKLGEEMKKPSTSTPTTQASKPSDISEHQKKEMEKLDQELEGHATNVVPAAGEPEDESTEALKAKLAKLKAEAASLGLSDAPPAHPAYGGGYRPYRGRGRGAPRSYYRGAVRGGGPPRGSMKLDNRPKKLLVKGVTDESVQALKGWFEIGGQVDSFEVLEDGKVAVAFKSRVAAEQALTKGSTIPDVGKVQISWFTTNANAPTTEIVSTPIHHPVEANGAQDSGRHSPPVEEEVVASGWGNDEEDGMGML